MNDGEFDRLKTASALIPNPHIWPVVVFAIETGMRRSEILGLELHHIDFDRQTALLPISKNGRTREVPLSHEALSVLRRQRNGSDSPTPFPANANAFRLAWDRLRARAGLSDLRFYDLRHESISRFFEMGLNMHGVAVISGAGTQGCSFVTRISYQRTYCLSSTSGSHSLTNKPHPLFLKINFKKSG